MKNTLWKESNGLTPAAYAKQVAQGLKQLDPQLVKPYNLEALSTAIYYLQSHVITAAGQELRGRANTAPTGKATILEALVSLANWMEVATQNGHGVLEGVSQNLHYIGTNRWVHPLKVQPSKLKNRYVVKIGYFATKTVTWLALQKLLRNTGAGGGNFFNPISRETLYPTEVFEAAKLPS